MLPASKSDDHARGIFPVHGRSEILKRAPAFCRRMVGGPVGASNILTVVTVVSAAARPTKAAAPSHFQGSCVSPQTLQLPRKVLCPRSFSRLVVMLFDCGICVVLCAVSLSAPSKPKITFFVFKSSLLLLCAVVCAGSAPAAIVTGRYGREVGSAVRFGWDRPPAVRDKREF